MIIGYKDIGGGAKDLIHNCGQVEISSYPEQIQCAMKGATYIGRKRHLINAGREMQSVTIVIAYGARPYYAKD
jgi:hypothetical protein